MMPVYSGPPLITLVTPARAQPAAPTTTTAVSAHTIRSALMQAFHLVNDLITV
jgi:hypothetical protein